MQLEQLHFVHHLQKNLPLFFLGIFGLYAISILLKNRKRPNKDIDQLIAQKKRTLGALSAKDNSRLTQLRNCTDPQIIELIQQLEWGDPLGLPLLDIPFANKEDLITFQLKRFFNTNSSAPIKDFTTLLKQIEQHFIHFYTKNPIAPLVEDDILTAFQILGLPQDCTKEDIKQRYRALSQKFHPDRFSPKSQQKYRDAINNNYITIKKAYDLLIAREGK